MEQPAVNKVKEETMSHKPREDVSRSGRVFGMLLRSSR